MQLRPPALDDLLPDLVGDATVVALVPATLDLTWAGDMAWRVARALAATGRRTALVDCFVDTPQLQRGAGDLEGLVDAFEYGASLTRIVRPQPEPNLFFIAAGTYSPDPRPLMAHVRWRRLAAGFRHEQALLLLYAPDGALDAMAAEPDGMIVLAPKGMDVAIADWPGVAEAVGRGVPGLLGVIADEALTGEDGQALDGDIAPAAVPAAPPDDAPVTDTDVPRLALVPAAEAEEAADEEEEAAAGDADRAADTAAPDEGAGHTGALAAPLGAGRGRSSVPMGMLLQKRRTPWGLIAALLVIAAGAAAGWVFRADLQRLAGMPPQAVPADTAPPAPPPPPPVESLPWAVQVSAWRVLTDAFLAEDSLEMAGIAAMSAPIRLQGRTWYRVYAGPLASRERADSLLAALRVRGVVAEGAGIVVSLPLSFALPGGWTPARAQEERMRLRAAGIPSFILGQADGTYHLFAGAYDGIAPAALLRTLLTPTGGAPELVTRMGYLP